MSTTSAREHVLLEELRAARIDLARAAEEVEDAKCALASKKTVVRKIEMLIEEILDEVTAGRRRDPLIQYAEHNAEVHASPPPSHHDWRRLETAAVFGDEIGDAMRIAGIPRMGDLADACQRVGGFPAVAAELLMFDADQAAASVASLKQWASSQRLARQGDGFPAHLVQPGPRRKTRRKAHASAHDD